MPAIKLTTEEFIKKAKSVHGNKYDYSLVKYIRSKENIKIICLAHGTFNQRPDNHLSGNGCVKCKTKIRKENSKYNKKTFIEKSKEIHNNKYTYFKIDYKNYKTKIIITCPIHGDFSQFPFSHIYGSGCSKCSNNTKLTVGEFIKKSKLIHGDKYDYSLVDYKNNWTKVKIICPKHKEFKQQPQHHTNGSGCPTCKMSIGVVTISKFLSDFKIKFITEKRFNDCRNILPLPFDFYIPDLHLCIEYDGQQHFKPMGYESGVKKFKNTIKRDEIKNNYCKEKNIKLIRIGYKDNINEILTNNILLQLK